MKQGYRLKKKIPVMDLGDDLVASLPVVLRQVVGESALASRALASRVESALDHVEMAHPLSLGRSMRASTSYERAFFADEALYGPYVARRLSLPIMRRGRR